MYYPKNLFKKIVFFTAILSMVSLPAAASAFRKVSTVRQELPQVEISNIQVQDREGNVPTIKGEGFDDEICITLDVKLEDGNEVRVVAGKKEFCPTKCMEDLMPPTALGDWTPSGDEEALQTRMAINKAAKEAIDKILNSPQGKDPEFIGVCDHESRCKKQRDGLDELGAQLGRDQSPVDCNRNPMACLSSDPSEKTTPPAEQRDDNPIQKALDEPLLKDNPNEDPAQEMLKAPPPKKEAPKPPEPPKSVSRIIDFISHLSKVDRFGVNPPKAGPGQKNEGDKPTKVKGETGIMVRWRHNIDCRPELGNCGNQLDPKEIRRALMRLEGLSDEEIDAIFEKEEQDPITWLTQPKPDDVGGSDVEVEEIEVCEFHIVPPDELIDVTAEQGMPECKHPCPTDNRATGKTCDLFGESNDQQSNTKRRGADYCVGAGTSDSCASVDCVEGYHCEGGICVSDVPLGDEDEGGDPGIINPGPPPFGGPGGRPM